jgi:HlyD family secretion protein
MRKHDSTLSTFAAAAALALAIAALVPGGQVMGPGSGAAVAAEAQGAARSPWAASATGRIEPKDGEIRISAQVGALITEVPVKTGDRGQQGDLLVRLDDADLKSKLLSAKAEVEVREREREEEPVTKGLALDRRKAQDAVAMGERNVFAQQDAFDLALAIFRAGNGKADDVVAARQKLSNAKGELADARAELAKVEQSKELQLMTRLETALEQSRADVSQLETAIEKTRVRAPTDGTVLNVFAKAGELAAPSPEAPLLYFGDVTSLRVRAELEEREVVKVKTGQAAVIKVDAYPDREFPGTVTSIAASLGAPRIVARGPRRPNDVEVLEVLVALDGQPPLLPGMRVDVFFRADSGQHSSVTDEPVR